MEVNCDFTLCIFHDKGACTQKSIRTDTLGQCDTYKDYTDGPDYQSPYWKIYVTERVEKSVGRKGPFKIAAKGKRIEVNGFVLYTEQDDRDGDFGVTEERTGALGRYTAFRDNPQKCREAAEKYPNVIDLPEIEEVGFLEWKLKDDGHD